MKRIEPGPGQESVWDYPRPPRVEPCSKIVRVEFGGRTIARSERVLRVLETSHPPVYYLPVDDVEPGVLHPVDHIEVCEFKGLANYYDVIVGEKVARTGAWTYHNPRGGYELMRDHVAFYAGPMEACWVDEERALAQPGSLFGGWITDDVVGPFKGSPGTMGW